MLKLIACVDKNNGIGKNGSIPWNIKEEMNHFKTTTTNHIVVMGSKTFKSMNNKPLPNRRNIIISNKLKNSPGVEVTNDIRKIVELGATKDVFIIGGSEIYELFEPFYDELIISTLDDDYKCDRFLKIDLNKFKKTKSSKHEQFTINHYKPINKNILYAKPLANVLKKELAAKIEKLKQQKKIKPKIVIMQVGNNDASNIYVRNKARIGDELGAIAEIRKYDEKITEQALINEIKLLNKDKKVHGILLQKPLPNHINDDIVDSYIDCKKDVDGFNPINVGNLWNSKISYHITPCTPLAIIKLLQYYHIDIAGKDVVIIGRSNIVSKPLASLFIIHDATVQICHSKTKDLAKKTKQADIIVSAIGKANYLDKKYFSDNQVIIDVGINRDKNNKVCGDVDFKSIKFKNTLISPVPGGVGVLTTIIVFWNLLICIQNQSNI